MPAAWLQSPLPNRVESSVALFLRKLHRQRGKMVCAGNRTRLFLLRDDSRLILTVSPGKAVASAATEPGEPSSKAVASAGAALEGSSRYYNGFGRCATGGSTAGRTSCHDSRRPVRACVAVVLNFVTKGRLRSTRRNGQRCHKATRTR